MLLFSISFQIFPFPSQVHDPRSVVTPAAYILFYQRRDSRFPAGVRIANPVKYLVSEQQREAEV